MIHNAESVRGWAGHARVWREENFFSPSPIMVWVISFFGLYPKEAWPGPEVTKFSDQIQIRLKWARIA